MAKAVPTLSVAVIVVDALRKLPESKAINA
jgi:hypothetical protein